MIYAIFIIPLLVMMTGFLMYKYPPQKVNWFIGYRTRKSMNNENVWKMANEYCGKLWIKIGLIMLAIALLLCVLTYFEIVIFTETLLMVIVFCEVGLLLLSGLMVENKIKKYK